VRLASSTFDGFAFGLCFRLAPRLFFGRPTCGFRGFDLGPRGRLLPSAFISGALGLLLGYTSGLFFGGTPRRGFTLGSFGGRALHTLLGLTPGSLLGFAFGPFGRFAPRPFLGLAFGLRLGFPACFFLGQLLGSQFRLASR